MKALTRFCLLLVLMAQAFQAAPQDSPPVPGQRVRIKDLADWEGVRDNQLIGYGIVVGLDGTGDTTQNKFTPQAIANYLSRMGITMSPDAFQTRNTAAVAVTATLPPFARVGSRIDVTVSSMGSAKSLQGGLLLITPLKGGDSATYAVAQGPLSIGGFNASQGGAATSRNHPTVGRIPNGAIVEQEVPFSFADLSSLSLVLRRDDFTTTQRVVDAINQRFPQAASALDPRTIQIAVPEAYRNRKVALVAELENLSITPDQAARVVINERTGTIVFGDQVRIHPIALAHGGISVTVQTRPVASQPEPLSQGQTVTGTETTVDVQEQQARWALLEGATVQQVVRTLNALGATPRDLIAILQAIKESGALEAELEIL